MRTQTTWKPRGFTLVELLVVIGIIAVLISILLPTLAKAREQANAVKCMSNLRQVGISLQLYANQNSNYLWPEEAPGWDWTNTATTNPPSTAVDSTSPPGDSQETRIAKLWPNAVWGRANPPEMMCPNDENQMPENFDQRIWHSYMVNGHLTESEGGKPRKLNRFGLMPGALRGANGDSVILAGEKVVNECDYSLSGVEYAQGKVDAYKHGTKRGSNYLYLDLHVSTELPPTKRTDSANPSRDAIDPWDLLKE